MKKNTCAFRISVPAAALFLLCILLPSASADEGNRKHRHDHHHARMAGPNGGKVLHDVHPHAELFVTRDRKLQVTFLTGKGKATAPGKQSISVICGKRTSPTRMKFARKGNSFLSDKALPKGLLIPAVIQIRMSPKAKSTIIRLNLNLAECSGCDSLEYACLCDQHGHTHGKKPATGRKK